MFFQGQYCLLTAFYFTPSSHHQAFLKFNLPHQNLQHPPKAFKMSLKQFLGRLQKMVLFTIKLSTRITQPPQKLQVVCLTSVLVPFFSKYHQGYPTFKLEAIDFFEAFLSVVSRPCFHFQTFALEQSQRVFARK